MFGLAQLVMDTNYRRGSLFSELEGYVKKLPKGVIVWTDYRTVGISWEHDFRRPQWGSVVVFINVDSDDLFQAAVFMLKNEIWRYEQMKG